MEPVGTHDIAERAGVKRTTVDQWRLRGIGFPEPRWTVSNRPAWERDDVLDWLRSTGREEHIAHWERWEAERKD